MAKSSKLRVMLSSRCNDKFPAGSATTLTDLRKELKTEIEAMEIAGRKAFEVWINEDAPPAGGTWDSWDVCIQAVKDCDILLIISNGNAGWANGSGDIGICHAEMMTGLSTAPAKVRLIALDNIASTKDAAGTRNKRFQNELSKQSLFRGATVTSVNDLKARVKQALYDSVVSLAQAGVRDAAKGKFHSGAALDWSRLDFGARQTEMIRVLREALLSRAASFEDAGKLFVKMDGRAILVERHAIPAALTVGPARESVGQPFLRDHKLESNLTGKRGGPLHVIACHKTAIESQAAKLLGFPDATLVAAPFGVFVADPIQKVQFAFITNCRDDDNTRYGLQRFMEWLSQTGEEKLLADRAQARARIVRAVTRGLNPNAPLKHSGIPWLGDIPKHWEVMRLKSLVTDSVAGPYGSSLTKAMYVHEGYRVYGQQQVIPDDFKTGDYYITPEKFALMGRYQVYPDDVLVSVMGTVGRVAVVPQDAEQGIINPRLVRYRPYFARVRSRYIQLTMQAPSSRDQLLEGSKGTTMDGLNMGILGRLLLVIPPLTEQDQILSFVRKETATLNTAIARTEREIALMQEYRTRLTADVVTGKLDVRAAAAHVTPLPADSTPEPPADEPLEETETDEIEA